MNPHKYNEPDNETVQLKRVMSPSLREQYPDGMVGARPTDRRVLRAAGFEIITTANYDQMLKAVSERGFDVATPASVLNDLEAEGLL